jgi:RimJ/RimL family protein N-acetyltransferase
VTRLAGDRVTLRAYRESEAPRLVETWADAEWFAPRGTEPRELAERVHERIARSGSFAEGVIILAIEAGGRLVGEVQARQPVNGLPRGVFELGIELFEQGDRGRGLGAEAVAAITRHLFADEGAHRVQLTTDVENTPMRRVAERLGFSFEGVLRSFMPEPGGARDYAMYAITKSDHDERNDAWI